MTKKFKHIEPPFGFRDFYTKYPHGYSIYEALLEWVQQVNDLTDLVNTIPDNIKQATQEQLLEWLEDGTLAEIINDVVLSSKLDVDVFNTFLEDYNMLTARLDSLVFDVRKYGILPGVNITPQLQTLVNLVSSVGGGVIYFPNGNYMIGKGLEDVSSGVVLKNNVTLKGQSTAGVNLYPANEEFSNGMLYAVGRSKIVIENLTINGRIIQTSFKSRMIRLKACNDSVVKNVAFENIDGTGIIISECVNPLLSHLTFKNIDGNELTGSGVGGQCIYAEDLKGGLIENIHAENIGDHVIYFDCTEGGKGERYTIRDIFAKNTGTNGATQGAAINITNTQEHFIVDGVVLEDVETGIRLGNNGGRNLQPKFFTLSNIHIKSTKRGAGVYIHHGGVTRTRTYGTLSNITIQNTGLEDITKSPYGLRLEGVSNMNLSNIMINGTKLNGVRLSIVANILIDNLIVAYVATGSAEGDKYGVYIQNPSGTSNGRVTINKIAVELDSSIKALFNATGSPLWLSDYNFNTSSIDNSGTLTTPTVTTTP